MLVMEEIKDFSEQREITIRRALLADAGLLWQWANDRLTRTNSFNIEPISWEMHQNWLVEKLASLDCRLWIMELDKIAVGQIRYDRTSAQTAQISFSVAPSVRGRGLGTLLLEKTAPMAARELGVNCLFGIALSDNQASQRAFVKARFTATECRRVANRECVIFSAQVSAGRLAAS